jgi:hypothetical protein
MLSATSPTVTSGDIRIDALLGPLAWASDPDAGPLVLTYGFPDGGSTWSTDAGAYGPGGSAEPWTGFAPLDDTQRQAVREALYAWGAVANLRFEEVPDDANGHGRLRFGWTASPSDEQSHAYGPGTSDRAGDVWLNSRASWDGFVAGSYGRYVLMHEIGHALGLRHPFEGPLALPPREDGYANSILSYQAYTGIPDSWTDFEPTTPMRYDVLAVQYLYGPNTGSSGDDDTYVFSEHERYFGTLWDAGGTDTLVWRSETQGARIDLTPGSFSALGEPNVFWIDGQADTWSDDKTTAIACSVWIENAVGGNGHDRLLGNVLPNALSGEAGDDALHGLEGDDTLTGAGGDDSIDGGPGIDRAEFSGNLRDYLIDRSGATLIVSDTARERDGTDTLQQVESLRFSDVSVNLTVQGIAAATDPAALDRIAELYLGFFGRVPAADGLEHWLRTHAAGRRLPMIADDFHAIGSGPALRSFTGYWDFVEDRPLDDDDYIRIVYRNVLGRDGLEAGIRYWSAQLAPGGDGQAPAETRGSVVCTMLDSAHALKGRPIEEYGWIADLLDNRLAVSKRIAVDWGLNYASTPERAIERGMAIAAAVTADSVESAIELVGIDGARIDLMP